MSMNLNIYDPVSKKCFYGLYQTSTKTTYECLAEDCPSNEDVFTRYKHWLKTRLKLHPSDYKRHIITVEKWLLDHPESYFCAT
jgi:hypothetical protein